MKKNLRIVSAAAAALLAVAPIAASAVSTVNADLVTDLGNMGNVDKNAQVKVSAKNVVLNAADSTLGTKNTLTGTITASVNGQSVTGNLDGATNVLLDGTEFANANLEQAHLVPGDKYNATVGKVSFNVGTANANKKLTVALPSNISSSEVPAGKSASVSVDQNGYLTLTGVVIKDVKAVNLADAAGVYFASTQNGTTSTPVTAGNIEMSSNNGLLNVNAVVATAASRYTAYQNGGHGTNPSNPAQINHVGVDNGASVNNLKEALKKANVSVDSNGFFTAPKSFNFNLVSNKGINNAVQNLPISVNVPNGVEATPAQEVTKNVTVMHIATIYDKNGKATTEPVLRAYNSVSVVSEPVTINGAKFYKLAGKDQYIKVGNIDGTKRTLKHNSYVYKSNGKAYTHKVGKKTKKVLKKSGEEVTTYGKSFMIHGSQMWRIGKNQYIKVRNF